MRNIQTVFVAALLMGLAGCATTEKASSVFDCAPAGYESLKGWEVRDYRPGRATKTESGDPVDIVTVVLSRGEQHIVLIFVGKELVMLDPNPTDKGVPSLVNARWFNKDNELKDEPSGACEWRPLLTGETA
jgi:hypothetical protein